jgi:GxxExxY protein
MDADEHRYKELTHQIIGAAFDVSNELGVGFLEKVYENAMFAELSRRAISATRQKRIKVQYKGVVVGDYIADLVVADLILIELKHVERLTKAHLAQALNYLKATGFKLCIIINFGTEKIEYKRVILD